MAVDHALLEQVQQDGIPVLRLYRWQPACLSFGRNQPARGLYSEAAANSLGIDIVRRPTGGMTVLHDRELTYAFIGKSDLLGGARETYCAVNRALVAGLARLGIPATLSGGIKRSPFGTVHPCFAEPAAGEVVAGGSKLVGSAQLCEKRTILQHGSILLDGTQDDVARIALVQFDVSDRATSVKRLIGQVPETSVIVAALTAGFDEACGTSLAPTDMLPGTAQRAAELAEKYRSAEWTWRR